MYAWSVTSILCWILVYAVVQSVPSVSRLDTILNCELLLTGLLNEASMSGSWPAVVPIPTPGPEVGPVTLIPSELVLKRRLLS